MSHDHLGMLDQGDLVLVLRRVVFVLVICIDTMFRLRAAFALLCSGCTCAALPVLDLPREVVTDVNKPPFPTVNVIADQSIADASQLEQLRELRSSQQSFLEKVTSAQQEFEAAAAVDLEAQDRQLNKLQQISAHIGVSAQGTR